MADGDTKRELTAGQKFDTKLASYFNELRQQSLSRRGLFRMAAGAAAMATAAKPFLPGLSVLAQDEKTVTFGLEADVRGLEPALAYDFTANPVVCQISEGLMMFDAKGELQPLLAESFDHPDALTYSYVLKQGLTFSDGTPVTIEDVVASIARVRDPDVAGPMAWMYDGPGAKVEQTDERSIKITLKTPSALFQFVPATTAGHVIPKAAIEKYGADLLRNPIGTGPFKFVKWDAGSEIVLEKNPTYWQTGMPYYDQIVYKIVPEGTTRVTGMKTGDLDMITAVPPDQIEAVKTMENVTWQEVVGYTANVAAMRTDKPPFDDLKVRLAVAHAIPYDDIMANIVKDSGVLAHNTTVPSNMPGSAEDQLQPVTYDVKKAKQLLSESSQPNGFKTTYNVIAPNDVWIPQAIAVQEALKELNIDVEIKQYAYADFITLQQEGTYEGFMSFQWGADFPDASGNLLPLFHSKNVPPQNNHAFYNNPDVDKLLDDSEVELDPEKRDQMLVDIQKKISDDQPMIFFEHWKAFMPMTSVITGYTLAPLWYWDSWGRSIKPA
ncbi:MAG: ABC transporter substrate-binding protein [Thermomicrobiales bacterium]